MNEVKKEKPASAGKTYSDVTIENLPNSEIEITGEIPVEIAETYRSKAISNIKKGLELPGFRKGNVPDEMVMSHIGETELMKEIAEEALGKTYADIVTDNKLDVVGRPQVTITKLAPKNPVGFKIKSAIFPTIELPDYKKIAKEESKKGKKEEIVISDEDVDKELKRLQQMMTPPPTEVDTTKEGTKDAPDSGKTTVGAPEINDEFAQTIGAFKDLKDLKEKMKEQMKMEREQKEAEKKRIALADAVISKSKLDVPNLFIEGEIEQMIASFTDRVTKAGMKMDDYLKQVGKTMEDLKKEWKPDAEKRAKLQLIFNEIAKKENLTPSPEKLAREITHIQEHYPEANKESVAVYVTAQMTNDMVFNLLEGKKTETETTENEEEHVHDENCDHDH